MNDKTKTLITTNQKEVPNMTIHKISKSFAIGAFALVAAMGSSTSSGTAADVSFKGKTIDLWMPSKSVGIRLFMEMWGQEISKHLPGNPKMIVKGKPGGGGLVGVNFLYNAVKPDGLAIGYIATPAMIALCDESPWCQIRCDQNVGSWHSNPELGGPLWQGGRNQRTLRREKCEG